MSVFVVRHGLSDANNRNNIGNLAFASKDALLMPQGRVQAAKAGDQLFSLGFNALTPVATSELARTPETARYAGFTALNAYPLLNEVEHGTDLKELRSMLDHGNLPTAALDAAAAIIENPPVEEIWFTHGLVIAGLSQILGVAQDRRLIPRFCEIRELPIT